LSILRRSRAASFLADIDALQLGDWSISFAALNRVVDRDKVRLDRKHQGICVLPAERSLAFVARFLALYELGVPQALVAPDWTRPELDARLGCLQRWFQLDEDGHVVRQSAPGAPMHHPDCAVVMFTSGSTGVPRAVQLSRRNIEANVAAVVAALAFEPAGEQVLFLPLHYSFGLLGQLLPALRVGASTRLVTGLVDVKALAERGELRGMVSGVPSHLEALVRLFGDGRHSPDRVTHVISAGAALPVPLRRRLADTFPASRIYGNYGQTELSPRALCMHSGHPAFFTAATGYPVGDIEVRLGEDDELQVRSQQIMLGYLGDARATAEVIVDGWLRTGDAATIAGDGLVTVLGRRDHVLDIGGTRVDPVEIESALAEVPGVAAAAVLRQDDELRGGVLVALLVGERPGALPGHAELKRRLREQLSPGKIPARFYQVSELPRTASGKLRRAALADLVAPGRVLS
jgi:long-chain acyl-CoA synthetase